MVVPSSWNRRLYYSSKAPRFRTWLLPQRLLWHASTLPQLLQVVGFTGLESDTALTGATSSALNDHELRGEQCGASLSLGFLEQRPW